MIKIFFIDNLNDVETCGSGGECIMKEVEMCSARFTVSLETESDDCFEEKTSSNFQSISSGLILKATYEHGKRSTEIMCGRYNILCSNVKT